MNKILELWVKVASKMQQRLLPDFAQCSSEAVTQQTTEPIRNDGDEHVTFHWSTCCKTCVHSSNAEVSACLSVSAPANHS